MEGAPAAGVSSARRLLGVWQRQAQASLHGRASVPVPPQCCRRNFLRCDAPRGVRGRQERAHRQGSERLRILAHANQGTEPRWFVPSRVEAGREKRILSS